MDPSAPEITALSATPLAAPVSDAAKAVVNAAPTPTARLEAYAASISSGDSPM